MGETLAHTAGSCNNFIFNESVFPMSLSTPGFFIVGCWNKDIPVPWKELFGQIELGLCSILSRAAVVKTWDFSVGGQIILSVLWWVIRSFSSAVDNSITGLYEIDVPRLCSFSIKPFFPVVACINIPK